MPSAPLYHPLERRRDIRLLRIESKSGGKSIEVDLGIFKLDSDVQYTALSYVWGNLFPQSWIVCNGNNVPISHNLWEVLSCLQKQEYHGLLWVDAICINQKDNKEKGLQTSCECSILAWVGRAI
jgi:hypothetical protein